MIILKLSDNKGIALITFYLAISLLVTLGIGFVMMGIYESRFTERFRNSKIAFNLAEAGADVAIVALRSNPSYTGVGFTTLGEGGYTVSVTTPVANPNWRRIDAIGYYPDNNTGSYGYTQREVELYVQVSPSNSGSRWSMFGNSEIDINGTIYVDSFDSRNGRYGGSNVSANGDIGTNSTGDADLKLNVTGQTATVYGDLVAGKGANPDTVISINGSITPSPPTKTTLNENVTLITPQVPPDAVNLGNLEMQGGQTLNLDAGNYFLTKLTTRNSLGNIPPPQIYATGKITLYVDGDIDVKRLYIYGQNTDPTKVTIKVIGDHDVKIENESHIHGVVYAPNSEVKLKQSTVWGAVIGDEIKVDGSATIHYDEALSTSGDYISGTTVDVLSWREPN